MPLNLLSWCALSFPLPHPFCGVSLFRCGCVSPPSSLLLAAWGTDFAADKAAAAAGRAKQYPGAYCSTAYATKHGWQQPTGQAPGHVSAGVYVSVRCVCHLYPLPLSISIWRIWLVFVHGWFKDKHTAGTEAVFLLCFGASCFIISFFPKQIPGNKKNNTFCSLENHFTTSFWSNSVHRVITFEPF